MMPIYDAHATDRDIEVLCNKYSNAAIGKVALGWFSYRNLKAGLRKLLYGFFFCTRRRQHFHIHLKHYSMELKRDACRREGIVPLYSI